MKALYIGAVRTLRACHHTKWYQRHRPNLSDNSSFWAMSVAENVMSGRHHKCKQGWWNAIVHTPMYRKDEKENWLKVKEIIEELNLENSHPGLLIVYLTASEKS